MEDRGQGSRSQRDIAQSYNVSTLNEWILVEVALNLQDMCKVLDMISKLGLEFNKLKYVRVTAALLVETWISDFKRDLK